MNTRLINKLCISTVLASELELSSSFLPMNATYLELFFHAHKLQLTNEIKSSALSRIYHSSNSVCSTYLEASLFDLPDP